MSLTLAGIIRDPDTGRSRGVRIVVDGGRLRVELSATVGDSQSAVDFSEQSAALVVALIERKDEWDMIKSDWTTLEALRKGAIFETRDGIRAVKSEYRYEYGGIECVLLASGEAAHFDQPGYRPEAHNATEVREVEEWRETAIAAGWAQLAKARARLRLAERGDDRFSAMACATAAVDALSKLKRLGVETPDDIESP